MQNIVVKRRSNTINYGFDSLFEIHYEIGGETSGLLQKSLMFWSHSREICLFLVNELSRCWNWI